MMTVGLRPNALGPGEPGLSASKTTAAAAPAPLASSTQDAAVSQKALTADPVTPPGASSQMPATDDKRLATELIAPQPPRDTDAPEFPRPPAESAGPLKTYAQIPTEMMQEISRLREEAAEVNVQGVPGRNDPTPMPASPEAIGTGRMPYDAA